MPSRGLQQGSSKGWTLQSPWRRAAMPSRGMRQGSCEWWTLRSPWATMPSRGLQQGSSKWWTLQRPWAAMSSRGLQQGSSKWWTCRAHLGGPRRQVGSYDKGSKGVGCCSVHIGRKRKRLLVSGCRKYGFVSCVRFKTEKPNPFISCLL